METLRRFLPLPEQTFFLLGPRGTGKSTWLRQQLPDAIFIDLLQPETYRRLSARPEALVELVDGARSDVVIDEVQRVPDLLTVVHHLIERGPKRRFVLTGSSARRLRRGGVDLLAGRALNLSMHPFLAGELPRFELANALEHGLVPLVIAAPDPAAVRNAYATLYLEQEVELEGWVRSVGSFARFLEAISFSHAAVLNVSEVARECHVERRTVTGYLEVLEDLLLAFRVPVFTRRARRRLTAHPKLYLFDAGIYRSLRPRGPLDRAEEIDGCAFEGLVAQHLRAWIAYRGSENRLFYWRTPAGAEVDFVVYGSDGFWAIEVKNTRRVRPRDLRALRAFRTDFPESEPVLLYRGDEPLEIDGIRCLPGDVFLRHIHPRRQLTEP